MQANAEDLPFPDNIFDAYTIAFGIRNVPRIDRALAEARRVLKRGGQFLCLEFSHVDAPFLGRLYEAYSFHAIPRLGEWVAGDGQSYRYLVESIARFPDAEGFPRTDSRRGIRPRRFHPADRRRRRHPFRLEALRHACFFPSAPYFA